MTASASSIQDRRGTAGTLPGTLRTLEPVHVAALITFVVCMVAFRLTLAPGVSFGDSAEFQRVPATLGIPHPTGFSAYVLLGKLASLLPFGSVAYRANLLSAVAASLSAATAVLILHRVQVRPVVAVAAALVGVLNGIVWPEATTAEVSAVHLLYVTLIAHRLLIYRDGARPRDLVLAALLLGLAIANHPTAIVIAPFALVYGGWLARDALRRRPALAAQVAVAFAVGLAVVLYVPVRAQFGPADQYGRLTHVDGALAWLTGAQFHRSTSALTSINGVTTFLGDIPSLVGLAADRITPLIVPLALFGLLVGWFRERAFTLFASGLVGAAFYLYVNYEPALERYLLVGALFIAIIAALGLEWLAERIERRLPPAVMVVLLLPVLAGISHYAANDQSQDHGGEQFVAFVFSQLPQDAVILTYWDAAQPMAYQHCIEGWRPDVTILAPFDSDVVRCDPLTDLHVLVATRPVFALYEGPNEPRQLAQNFTLTPLISLQVPFGARTVGNVEPLYRVTVKPFD